MHPHNICTQINTKHLPNLTQQLRKTSLDTGRVSATDGLEELAALVELKSRHSGDTVVGSDFGELVDVDLEELNAGVLLAQLLEDGRDGLARTAPGGEVIDDDGALGLCDLGLECVGAGANISLGFFYRRNRGSR